MLDSTQQLLAIVLHDHQDLPVCFLLKVADAPQIIKLAHYDPILLLPILLLMVQPLLIMVDCLLQDQFRIFSFLLEIFNLIHHGALSFEEVLAKLIGLILTRLKKQLLVLKFGNSSVELVLL